MSHSTVRVLIADDDPTARILMESALETSGFALTLVEDGAQALEAFRAEQYDVVLLDVDMPGLNGYQVCEEIRSGWGEDVPVVLVTGYDDVQSIEHAYQVGATDFISKPINWALLGHRLRYILRSAQAIQSLHAAEARNRAILRALPDLLLRIDLQGNVLERHGNTSLQVMFLGTPEALQRCLPAVARAHATCQVQEVSMIVAGADDQDHRLGVRMAPMGDGETLCLVRTLDNA